MFAFLQIRERELSDNLQLRKQQEDVVKLERQIDDFEKQLGGLDPKNLERERQQLLQKDDELNKEVWIFGLIQVLFKNDLVS